MIKYVDVMVTFAEVPNEIALSLNISNCPNNCKGCHSPYLRDDIGTELNYYELGELLRLNQGITCICFLGGDANPEQIDDLAKWVKDHYETKTAWYSGVQELSEKIHLDNFDYIKLGPYIEEKGPLTKKTTNQVMLEIDHSCGRPIVKDITSRFWK